MVDAPGDVLERMRDQAARIGAGTLTRWAEVVHAGLGEMRGATAPRLLLEVVCARLLLPSASDTESALLQRVERIETRLDMSIPADATTTASPAAQPIPPPTKPAKQYARKMKAPAPAQEEPAPEPASAPEPKATSAPEPKAAPEPAEPPPPSPPPVQPPADPVVEAPAAATAGEPDAAAIRRQWSTVLDKVRDRSRSLAVMLAGAVVRAVDGGTLVLNHESAPLAKRLGEQRNAEVVAEALKDALGMVWKVRYEVGLATDVPATVSADADGIQVQRDEEDSMLAEAGSDTSETLRRDPEEAALELLQNELGARRIDGV